MCVSAAYGHGLEYRKLLHVFDNLEFLFIIFIIFLCYLLVLSDPAKRLDYDLTGTCEVEKYSLQVCNSDLIKCLRIIYMDLFMIVSLYPPNDNCCCGLIWSAFLIFIQEYLARFKGMILTCNGLGINHADRWYLLLIFFLCLSICLSVLDRELYSWFFPHNQMNFIIILNPSFASDILLYVRGKF